LSKDNANGEYIHIVMNTARENIQPLWPSKNARNMWSTLTEQRYISNYWRTVVITGSVNILHPMLSLTLKNLLPDLDKSYIRQVLLYLGPSWSWPYGSWI